MITALVLIVVGYLYAFSNINFRPGIGWVLFGVMILEVVVEIFAVTVISGKPIITEERY